MKNNVKSQGRDKSETIVFPSEKLGVEEEFLPTNSTYVENHEVKAALIGKLFIDRKKHRARIFPLNRGSKIPQRNDIVIGQVIKVSRSSLRINIGYLKNKPVIPVFSAIMHISDASRDYIKEIDDYFVGGDIVRARIIDAKTYPLQLECKGNDLGVIYAYCLKCGKSVDKIKKNLVICTVCKYKQSRATTIDFGNFSLIPEY